MAVRLSCNSNSDYENWDHHLDSLGLQAENREGKKSYECAVKVIWVLIVE